MAVVATRKHRWVNGDRTETITYLALDSSYPTGGEALTAANLGLQSLQFVSFEAQTGYIFKYDYTNSKLLAYVSGGTEVTDTTDLSAITALRVRAVGR